MLPQACQQLTGVVRVEHEQGHLRVDVGWHAGQADAAVEEVSVAMEHAFQGALADVSLTGPGLDEG